VGWPDLEEEESEPPLGGQGAHAHQIRPSHSVVSAAESHAPTGSLLVPPRATPAAPGYGAILDADLLPRTAALVTLLGESLAATVLGAVRASRQLPPAAARAGEGRWTVAAARFPYRPSRPCGWATRGL
jgi:hypothetical protein